MSTESRTDAEPAKPPAPLPSWLVEATPAEHAGGWIIAGVTVPKARSSNLANCPKNSIDSEGS
jgi:hypothetical protein